MQISDEAVESAAEGIALENLRSKPWEAMSEAVKDTFRADARAALEAAAPHMLAEVFDEGVQAGMVGWNNYKERDEIDNPYR